VILIVIKMTKDWNVVCKGLCVKIRKNQDEITLLKASIEVSERDIKELKKKIQPTVKQIYKVGNIKHNLETELREAKYEAFIQNLKVGDKVWVLYLPYGKGDYATRTDEEYARTKGCRNEVFLRHHPFQLEIVEVLSDERFLAKRVGSKELFRGKVWRHGEGAWSQFKGKINWNYIIMWRKLKG